MPVQLPIQSMTQPSRIPILSPVLFMHVGDPNIPPFKFEEFLIYLYTKGLPPLCDSDLVHLYMALICTIISFKVRGMHLPNNGMV